MNIFKSLSILNAFGLLGTLLVNYLANSLPINGLTTGDLSDFYPNLFVPAGITFIIWAFIYASLVAFVIFSFTKIRGAVKTSGHFLTKISFYFFLSCLLNVCWILAWHYKIVWLSLILMIVLFLSLLTIYIRLDIGRNKVSPKEFWFVHVPFSMYFGWITVATISNFTAFFVDIEWSGFGIQERIWAMMMIVIAAIIALNIFTARKDYMYNIVIIWALLGIFIKRNDLSGIGDYVGTTALGAMLILIVSILTSLLFPKKETAST